MELMCRDRSCISKLMRGQFENTKNVYWGCGPQLKVSFFYLSASPLIEKFQKNYVSIRRSLLVLINHNNGYSYASAYYFIYSWWFDMNVFGIWVIVFHKDLFLINKWYKSSFHVELLRIVLFFDPWFTFSVMVFEFFMDSVFKIKF